MAPRTKARPRPAMKATSRDQYLVRVEDIMTMGSIPISRAMTTSSVVTGMMSTRTANTLTLREMRKTHLTRVNSMSAASTMEVGAMIL